MQCPNCGAHRIRVVLTTYSTDKDIVRRRRCLACEHRWYTIQQPEKLLDGVSVAWEHRGPVTLRSEAGGQLAGAVLPSPSPAVGGRFEIPQ